MKVISRQISILIVLASFLYGQNSDSQFVSGKSYWGKNHFIEFIPGDIPIIFSTPHGGTMMPEYISNRTFGVSKKDMGTQELTKYMVEAFIQRTGKRPYVILNNLHRKKMDPNREIHEAAQENIVAESAWKEYHSFIDTAKQLITQRFGKGFYMDVHGHGHKNQQVEIGYCLNSEALGETDETLNEFPYCEMTSLVNLLKISRYTHSQLLRDTASFGAFLEKYSIRATPSPRIPYPHDEKFFGGGYSTQRHTADVASPIFGLQLETNTDIRYSNGALKNAAPRIVNAIIDYLNIHWKSELLTITNTNSVTKK